jgi:hypothetical protein
VLGSVHVNPEGRRGGVQKDCWKRKGVNHAPGLLLTISPTGHLLRWPAFRKKTLGAPSKGGSLFGFAPG